MHTDCTGRAVKITALLILSIIGFIVLGSVVSASGLLNAVNPSKVGADSTPAVVPPLLAPPPGAAAYTQYQDIKQPITTLDKRPVAQLADPAAERVESISVYAPDTVGLDEQVAEEHEIYYQVLASIEYKVNGRVFLITTARPSPKAAQQATAFGDQEIQLPNGITAWVTTGVSGTMPNRVVFLKDDLIITLVGDLPPERLQALALQVIVP